MHGHKRLPSALPFNGDSMKKSNEIAELLAQKREAVKGILALDNATEEQLSQADTLMVEIKAMDTDYQRAVDREQFAAENDRQLKALSTPVSPVVHPTPGTASAIALGVKAAPVIEMPGMVTSLKNFKGPNAELQAYKFGQWFLSCVVAPAVPDGQYRYQKSVDWVKEHTPYLKAQSESNNADGGALVPQEFDRQLIDLREKYGIFRRYTKVTPMVSDTKIVPRRVSGLTAYFVNDNVAITESQKGWDNVQLVAKKVATLTKYSSEVAEDAIINMGDDLAGEIAYAFSLKEDQCGFTGDGTSTYGGMVGINNAMLNLSATRANIAGLVVGTGNAFSELVLADFHKVVGRLPEYADTPNARWFVHKTFYHEVMEKLMLASGGVPAAEIRDGVRVFRFLGYEVVFTQVLPKAEANDIIVAVLGDLALGTRMGDRRQNTIAIDTSLGFANDQWAIRGTERFDIVCHDLGNASATSTARVAGPIVALATAAS
jgi:HK97 family phage major capsid protein